ncbi:MAG: S8 family serine peptidase [Chryseolinea sp.]
MGWNKGQSLLLLMLLLSSEVFCQVDRYMVLFKDKAASPFVTSKPNEFLSQRAINRRSAHRIEITDADLPVNSTYVEEIAETGAMTFFTTKWMNGLLVQCDAAIVPVISSLDFVQSVELVAPNARLMRSGRVKANGDITEGMISVKTDAQLRLIGLDEMHAAGYKGETIHIGIFDSGFQGVNSATAFQHLFNRGRVDQALSKDFVLNSDNVFQHDDHGTQVLSVMAGYQEGIFTGGSFDAEYQLYVTEDVSSEYRVEEYNWLFAAERADSAGVDIVNSSLGYYDFDDASMNYPRSAMDGKTSVVSKAAQWLADRGVLVVCSAGNEGAIAWQIITAPADAKDVLAIASVNGEGQRAGSSSIGPSADGRVKPDVAAMGVNTSVIKPNGATGNASGTSLASPLIASLAAGVWQRYPNLSNKEIIAAIRNSASQASSPDNLIGYGIPNFRAVVNYLERQDQENAFVVYPNPVTADTIVIRPADPSVVTQCKMELVSSQGQILYTESINFSWLERSYTANLSGRDAGLYFLRLWWDGKPFTFKLIKVPG